MSKAQQLKAGGLLALVATAGLVVAIVTAYLPAVGWLLRRRPLALGNLASALGTGALLSLIPWTLTMILLTSGTFRGMLGPAGMLLLIVHAVSGSLFTAGALAIFGSMRRSP